LQNGCIATILDASHVAAIATIIAVAAVVVAAVDGSSERDIVHQRTVVPPIPCQKFYVTFIADDKQ
jgi:hypothetical protein